MANRARPTNPPISPPPRRGWGRRVGKIGLAVGYIGLSL
jgi:hypothetical protein